MRLGERVTPRHSLRSSHPVGLTVKRTTEGVIAEIDNSTWGIPLYNVVFEVPGHPDRIIMVEGIGDRDVIPVLLDRQPRQRGGSISKAS